MLTDWLIWLDYLEENNCNMNFLRLITSITFGIFECHHYNCGSCTGDGNCYGVGFGSGIGSGRYDGYGNGYGNGYGDGFGCHYGNQMGNGLGNGFGYNYCYGYQGDGFGDSFQPHSSIDNQFRDLIKDVLNCHDENH